MSLLRIYAPLGDAPLRCGWALIDARRSTQGEGPLAGLPRGAQRVQLVVPAAQVLITRASLPPRARRRDASLLAFAVEEAVQCGQGCSREGVDVWVVVAESDAVEEEEEDVAHWG